VFEITAADAAEARRYDKNHCVVANAVLGTIPGITGIQVGKAIVQVRTDSGIRRYRTPVVLAKALAKFDESGYWGLKPGVYTLQPPPPHMTREAIAAQHLRSKTRRRDIDPKTGKRYMDTGFNTREKRTVNPRVLEFAKIKKAKRAA